MLMHYTQSLYVNACLWYVNALYTVSGMLMHYTQSWYVNALYTVSGMLMHYTQSLVC